MYRTEEDHSADCQRYPYETMPMSIFLDTSVVNLLVKFANCVFECESIPSELPVLRAHDIEALMHLMQVGARAHWTIMTSPKALSEMSETPDPAVRADLQEYADGLLQTHN